MATQMHDQQATDNRQGNRRTLSVHELHPMVFRSVGTDASDAEVMDLYETLGVDKTADSATIKRAYRKKAMATHPDREGGDSAAFQSVELAHRILSDEERREKYDRNGTVDDQPDTVTANAMQMVAQIINALIERQDAVYIDLIAEAKRVVGNALAEHQRQVKIGEALIERTEKMRKRFTAKLGKPDRIGNMLDQQVVARKQALGTLNMQLGVIKLAQAMLEDQIFVHDSYPMSNSAQGITRPSGGGLFWNIMGGPT